MIDRSYSHLLGHPNADNRGYILKYRLLAAKVLGKPLPPFAVIHHHGENQLVIYEDTAYHRLLESREAALTATGDVHKRKCRYCKQYDEIKNLKVSGIKNKLYHHIACATNYKIVWRRNHRKQLVGGTA